ncbi:family 78 glycoside hydrolase catalytic domain [Occultella gossypii]|uniref:alpha-L-rhamnosidase n=1 Tax=Occultella gossypii TaxID=2800820 RepID=A0ABS7S9C6_9MICO|nr:family 78 glycoside hydrolase catalytic domain [Occultella gossypii]MBZ2196254.1 family 78 glycoside hydrolase catalytic domain [Occultella gossypii]
MPHDGRGGPLPAPRNLRVDARHPIGTGRFQPVATSAHPRISWVVSDAAAPSIQTAFQIVLREGRRAASKAGPAPLRWDSGTVEGADPWLRLPVPLAAHEHLEVTVRVRDDAGRWSPWATPAPLETGPLALRDFGTDWIEHPALHVLRREFELSAAVHTGRLHLTAQGLIRASVNGEPVNADASDPSRSDITRALYRSYDVGDLLRPGPNTLDLVLASGEWERTGLDPRALAVISVTSTDGTRTFHGTGPGMLTAPSAIRVQEPFYLEAHDLRAQHDFTPATELTVLAAHDRPTHPDQPPAAVLPDPGPPVHAVQTLRPTEIVGTAPNTDEARTVAGSAPRVWDVGVNVAGRSRITLGAGVPAGTVIRVVHGEHLDPRGRLDTTNLTMPYDHGRIRQALEFTVTGAAGEVLEARFCYHGFRYLEVWGLPAGTDVGVEVAVLHSDVERISELDVDDDAVATLVERARRTLLNNLHGIPEDCPTREQAGWTGDTASVTEFSFAAFDLQAFFTKWLGDLRTSQQPDGWIPAISPDLRRPRIAPDPVWGAALQRVLEAHWLHYGDLTVVLETLPALRAWVDFQLTCASADGTIGSAPISYGHDWLALEQTPPELHHTAAAQDALRVLADLEDLTGAADEANRRRTQAEALRVAARAAFVDDRGAAPLVESAGRRAWPGPAVGNGSQGSLALAIEAGWLTEAETLLAVEALERAVRARGNRVTSGFATTRTVVRALAHSGRSQAVFDALHQGAEPGIGAMLAHGPGTFWECWWIDPGNTGTGSLDHVGLGGPFAGWAWQHLAGLRPLAGGYSRFAVEPAFVDGVTSVRVRTETVRGTVGVDYERRRGRVTLEVRVPVGATAVVRLPGNVDREFGTGVHSIRADVPPAGPAVAPPDEPAWRPPARAPRAVDVDGGRQDLLSRLIREDRFTAAPAATTTVEPVPDGLHCMPVPHAQPPGPAIRVLSHDAGAVRAPTVRLGFDDPLDLSEARFVYALLDTCASGSTRPARSLLRLFAADGSIHETTSRMWPAGWNRVSLDVGGWPGRAAVVAVETGLTFSDDDDADDDDDDGDGDGLPAMFHLGELGSSLLRRTAP